MLPDYKKKAKKIGSIVIFVRYEQHWLYKKRKDGTYTIIHEKVCENRTPYEQAKYTLYRQLGVTKASIIESFDVALDNNGPNTSARVYYVIIESENDVNTACFKSYTALPDDMHNPCMLVPLYQNMQEWLNLQNNAHECWDVYDKRRNKVGRTHRRGDQMQKGDYHLTVHVWIRNDRGEYLITKRAPNKGNPGLWETTGGSAVAGDDSLTAAIREVNEETGLVLDKNIGTCIKTLKSRNAFCDVWLFTQTFASTDVVLQQGETIDAQWVSAQQITDMQNDGRMIRYPYWDCLLHTFETKKHDRLELFKKSQKLIGCDDDGTCSS